MNKEDVVKLAKECGATLTVYLNDVYWRNDGGAVFQAEQLLAFANACEKIGMEKAAKICDSSMRIDAADCAEAIRKAIE